jgi:hypothetical protein
VLNFKIIVEQYNPNKYINRMYRQQTSQRNSSQGALASQFNTVRLNQDDELLRRKTSTNSRPQSASSAPTAPNPQVPPTTPTQPTVPPTTPAEPVERQPGYGDKLIAGPKNSFFTAEIRDKDGDGIDDRQQTGPGGEKQKLGSMNEEFKAWEEAGRPPMEDWNFEEYKKKKVGISNTGNTASSLIPPLSLKNSYSKILS